MCLNRPSGRAENALKELKEAFPEGDIRLIPMDLRKFVVGCVMMVDDLLFVGRGL